MLKFKKAIAAALFGIGVGTSVSALAAASYESCVAWQEQCNEGDVQACQHFDAGQCWRWDF